MKRWAPKRKGFTIVEVLIVMVIIAILASMTLFSYRGIQQRTRDSQRQGDINTIAKALESYYAHEGEYPPGRCISGCLINPSWSTTNDGSWQELASYLVPKYLSALPVDPTASLGRSPLSPGNYGYAYFTNTGSGTSGIYCLAPRQQMFLLVYGLESGKQQNTFIGTCATNPISYAGKSNYRKTIDGS